MSGKENQAAHVAVLEAMRAEIAALLNDHNPHFEHRELNAQTAALTAAIELMKQAGEPVVVAHRLHQPNHSSAWINGDYTAEDDSKWPYGWSVERAYAAPTEESR
jgi:hypothetical protein